jgi:hypothetical protein
LVIERTLNRPDVVPPTSGVRDAEGVREQRARRLPFVTRRATLTGRSVRNWSGECAGIHRDK